MSSTRSGIGLAALMLLGIGTVVGRSAVLGSPGILQSPELDADAGDDIPEDDNPCPDYIEIEVIVGYTETTDCDGKPKKEPIMATWRIDQCEGFGSAPPVSPDPSGNPGGLYQQLVAAGQFLPKQRLENVEDLSPVRPQDTAYSSDPAAHNANLDSPYVSASTLALSWQETDCEYPSAGQYFSLNRTYNSRLSSYQGQYGVGWELNLHRRVRVIEWDPNNLSQPTRFKLVTGAGWLRGDYYPISGSQPDWFTDDHENDFFHFDSTGTPAEFAHYYPDGTVEIYQQLDVQDSVFYLSSVTDLSNNTVQFEYASGIAGSPTAFTLTSVVDSENGEYLLTYNPEGTLDKITLLRSGVNVGEIDYSYEQPWTDGPFLLAAVDGLTFTTKDANGDPALGRTRREYEYQMIGDLAFLSSVTDPSTGVLHEWTYHPSDYYKVLSQVDSPGTPEQGTHSYLHNTSLGTTDYVGPDGDHRIFYWQGKKITRLEEFVAQGQPPSVTTWDYDVACGCERVRLITYPDTSSTEFEYDVFGANTAIWNYPRSGSSTPARVQRLLWSEFNPPAGNYYRRLLEYELARDAAQGEDPESTCEHPSCAESSGVPGHIHYTYTWQDGLLTAADYYTVRAGVYPSVKEIHRTETYEYWPNGLQKKLQRFEDGVLVLDVDYGQVAATGKAANRVSVDPQTGEQQQESYSYDLAGRLASATLSDGTILEISWDASGNIIRSAIRDGLDTLCENLAYYRGNGTLHSTQGSSRGEVFTEAYVWNSPSLFSSVVRSNRGTSRTTSFDWTPGGKISQVTDWRGVAVSLTYGFGAWQLPVACHYSFAGQSILKWQAGDGGSDSGYDALGRRTSWRDELGLRHYQQYDGQGRLFQAFDELTAGSYEGKRIKYSPRGFASELLGAVLTGSPSNPSAINWLTHSVLSTNKVGQLFSLSLFAGGSSVAEMEHHFQLNIHGDPEEEYALISQPGSAPKYQLTRHTWDSFGRRMASSLYADSASATTTEVNLEYNEATRTATNIISFPNSQRHSEKVVSIYSALGELLSRENFSEISGSWTSTGALEVTWNGFGLVDTATDGGDRNLARVYGSFGLPLSSTTNHGGDVRERTYEYDPASGELSALIDESGGRFVITHHPDKFLLPKRMTLPDGSFWEVQAYDVANRPTVIFDGGGVTHTLTYTGRFLTLDTATKSTGNTWMEGINKIQYIYSPTTHYLTEARSYSGTNLVWKNTLSSNATGLTIADIQGLSANPRSLTFTLLANGLRAGTSYSLPFGPETAEYQYDEMERPLSAQFTDGQVTLGLEFDYDGLELNTVTCADLGIRQRLEQGASRSLQGLFTERLIGGAWSLIRGIERRGLNADVRIAEWDTGTGLGALVNLDAYGAVLSAFEGVPSPSTTPAGQNPTTWARKATFAITPPVTRTSVLEEEYGQAALGTFYAANASHFYNTVGPELRLQNNGRLVQDGSYFYKYDGWGRPSGIYNAATGVKVRTLVYDAFNRLASIAQHDQQPNSVIRFTYEGVDLVLIEESGGAVARNKFLLRQHPGGQPFGMRYQENGGAVSTLAFVMGFQDSLRAVIEPSTGLEIERYDYSAFGEPTIRDSSGQVLTESDYGILPLFHGMVYDTSLDGYLAGIRIYDPRLGCFNSFDPMYWTDSMNLFQYGMGNPYWWADPFGLKCSNEDGIWEKIKMLGSLIAYSFGGVQPSPEMSQIIVENMSNDSMLVKAGDYMASTAVGQFVDDRYSYPDGGAFNGWQLFSDTATVTGAAAVAKFGTGLVYGTSVGAVLAARGAVSASTVNLVYSSADDVVASLRSQLNSGILRGESHITFSTSIATTEMTSNAIGQMTENLVGTALRSNSFGVPMRQVSVYPFEMTSRRVTDFVIKVGDEFVAIEVKANSGRLTAAQLAKDRVLKESGGRFVGEGAGELQNVIVDKLKTIVVQITHAPK